MSKSKEIVSYNPNASGNGVLRPSIDQVSASGEKQTRQFKTDDMARVLDFDVTPASPKDGPLFHWEPPGQFPSRHVGLRGKFLFYFDCKDVGFSGGQSTYKDQPIGVILLDRTTIDFPPGGRRLFQEHARQNAPRGYEFVIRHVPKDGESRDDTFLVAETLTLREEWAAALKVRAELIRDTELRPPGVAPPEKVSLSTDPSDVPDRRRRTMRRDGQFRTGASRTSLQNETPNSHGKSNRLSVFAKGSHDGGGLSFVGEEDDPRLKGTLEQFSKVRFDAETWVNIFFEGQKDSESEDMCDKLEATQLAVKRGMRGAVLEQYKYFVEASREMTTMGSEVASLKSLVENQVEAIDKMKSINFAEAFNDPVLEEEDYYSSSDDGEEEEEDDESLDLSAASSQSSLDEDYSPSVKVQRARRQSEVDMPSTSSSTRLNDATENDNENPSLIEIPPWLSDVTEEISDFINACRFTEATELTLKAKAEVAEILNQHDKLTDRRLSKKQLTSMQRILIEIETLTALMGDRLSETLRRKNEALKQACKRERTDPAYELLPVLSPICINDDSIALQLLVKLGRPKDAAVAYSNRRSLQLSESLNERPISGSASLDLVIYASQLCQGFFACLAMAVEGFLDLFLEGDSLLTNDGDTVSLASATNKKVPAGALASVVLWCDSELAKFASTFGGSRIIGRLNLAPLPSDAQTQNSELSGGGSANSKKIANSVPELKNQLRAAEEAGDYSGAANLRRKITAEEESQRKRDRYRGSREDSSSRSRHSGDGSSRSQGRRGDPKMTPEQERKHAIDVAAKCISQAFHFASENLDSIGLPLTPRLAESLRPRLKGCEAAIASLLEKRWNHIVLDWHVSDAASSVGEHDSHRNSRFSKK